LTKNRVLYERTEKKPPRIEPRAIVAPNTSLSDVLRKMYRKMVLVY
jgi:hypothetical protein